ncbi:phospholipid scramblase 1-like isoform X2 [Drosophila ficusphila]|uniref:phospholipid scramblase 1-like isoform X2 n=1 Tax=Drosophila ficusphila TaxID=30025 RepID=UPI0007E8800E|nr:phospholipid scramblase 1-like isoform X2 [Drosophila ficusphila]
MNSDAVPVQIPLEMVPVSETPLSEFSQPNEAGKPNQVGDQNGNPPSKNSYGYPVQPPLQPFEGCCNQFLGLPMTGYPLGHPPIVTQPGVGTGMAPVGLSGGWTNVIPNCLRGMEYLKTIDQLLVKQQIEFFEAITGFETNNRYSIQNVLGQKVFYAVEDTNCCIRNCCPERPFHMRIFEKYLKEEVIHLHRSFGCSSICCPCCLHKIEVSAPPGNVIGSIQEEWSICRPSFRILNQSDDLVLRIEGPLCFCSMCRNVDFNVCYKSQRGKGR